MSLKVGGDFFYEPILKNCKDILLVAGGVGINPLYSILQEIEDSFGVDTSGNDVTLKLLYSASSLDELIFKVSKYVSS